MKKKNIIKLRMSISNQEYLDPFLKKLNALFSSYYEKIYSKLLSMSASPRPLNNMAHLQELTNHTKKAATLLIKCDKTGFFFQAMLIY